MQEGALLCIPLAHPLILIEVSYEGVWQLKISQKIETQQEEYSEIPICCSTRIIHKKHFFLAYHHLLSAL